MRSGSNPGARAILLMAKRPRPGATKTRLCPPLLPEEAAALYEAFLRDAFASAMEVEQVQVAAAITPPEDEALAYFAALAPGALLLPVAGPTIGRCLERGFAALFARGFGQVAAVSTDSPGLSAALHRLAFDRLEQADLVLSPGLDGGYNWIGLRAPCPELFGEEIPWSTPGVLPATLSRASALGLRVDLAPPTLDVDTPGDLARLPAALARAGGATHTRAWLAARG